MANNDRPLLRDQGAYTASDRVFLDVWVPSIVFVCTLGGFVWILGSNVGWAVFWCWAAWLGGGAIIIAGISVTWFLHTMVTHKDNNDQDN